MNLDEESLLSLAAREIKGENTGYHALTRIMPSLLNKADYSTIDYLFSEWKSNTPPMKAFPYSAELMTFLSTPQVSGERSAQWVAAITGNEKI